MLEKNMETILSDSYKKSLSRRFKTPDFSKFIKFLECFDISKEEIQKILEGYVWKESRTDMIEFLIKELVYRETGNELYSRSVHLEFTEINTPYNTRIRYTVKYTSKLCVLEEYSSEWIWKNNKKVCEFMESTYNKLEGKFIDYD